jgi:S-DNA-T family DNA segregation ATPase FtsK/SpoIIIE
MAKKKKSKKSSKKSQAQSGFQLKEGLVAEIIAIMLIILAVLLLVAGFGFGGVFPTTAFRWTGFIFGMASYVFPFCLIYIAYVIFSSENHKAPWTTYVGLFMILMAISGLFHIRFDSELARLMVIDNDIAGGGLFGYGLDQLLLALLNRTTSVIVLVGMILIGSILSFNVTIKAVFDAMKARREDRQQAEDSSSSAVSMVNKKELKPSGSGLRLNSSVPLTRPDDSKSSKKTEAASREEPAALTASSDPDWNFPDVKLLETASGKADAGDWKGNADIIKQTLSDFGIEVEMDAVNVGPRVTQYTLKPQSGVRLTKITALEQNIALNLAAESIRIEAPIPGKRLVGIEVPNQKSAIVRLRSILESKQWSGNRSPLPIGIGQDISGDSMVASLDKMPHVLVAGQTGSGKSIMINSLLCSLLYRNSPSDMKLILVDPKQVELNLYNDIPHLLTPVITQPEKCISALKWAVAEMERRYSTLAEKGKRNIAEFNALKNEEEMPYIVIVIDELADLMMVAARDVESLIVRLAQKARATGIHLVLATQRPSVDVITGLIKANIPARIAFTTTSQVDSRTILDQAGAEKLLGKGDMLFTTPDISKPRRIQGVLIEEKEVKQITDHIRMERAPEYNHDIITQPVQLGGKGGVVADMDTGDSEYPDAVKVVVDAGKASASMLQRRLRVGYAKAARLIETMEEQGIVGPADGSRPREVLITSLDELDGDDTEETT